MKNFFTILSLIFITTVSAQNIYDWRGVDRTGFFYEENLLKEWPVDGPELIWSDSTIGFGYTSVLVDDKNVFVAGMIDSTGYIFCFDLNGEKVWQSAYGDEWKESFPGSRSNLVKKDDAIYFLSGLGLAFKMDATNGKIIWSHNLVEKFNGTIPYFGYSETPLLVDDKVFFTPGGENTMIAINQEDGSVIWKSSGKSDDKSGFCSARYIEHYGKKIIIQITKQNLWGFEYETGDSLWTYDVEHKWNDNSNPPYYFDGKIVLSSPYGNGTYLFQLSDDGTKIDTLWRNSEIGIQSGAFVVIDNHLYGASIDKKKWYCIDLSTGKTKWTSRGIRIGSIIQADNLIYVFSDMGDMAIVEPNTTELKIISKFKAFTGKEQFAHPAIKEGKLYLRSNNFIKVYNVLQEQ
jgi:outer membrane protein assembly factor BamB